MSSHTITASSDSVRSVGAVILKPELANPRVICLEEHISFPEITQQFSQNIPERIKNSLRHLNPFPEYTWPRLPEIGDGRIADMDKGGVTIQILSLAAAGFDNLSDEDATSLSQQVNDLLAQKIESSPQPNRFRAFAYLPFQAPEAAVKELYRCIKELGMVGVLLNGNIQGKFLDDPQFEPILAAACELNVPIYLHPSPPPETVWDSYYELPDSRLSATLATAGWGWHAEVAVHVLRIALGGVFEKFQNLKIVIGHQGEMLPMMMSRFDHMFNISKTGFKRAISQMLRDQVYVTLSGMFTLPPTLCTIQTFGIDHVLFANDYPFFPAEDCFAFIKVLQDVLAPADVRKILSENADSCGISSHPYCAIRRAGRNKYWVHDKVGIRKALVYKRPKLLWILPTIVICGIGEIIGWADLIAFLTADVVALIVQAVGGAKASLAFQNGHSPNPGGHVMLIGIVLQLIGILFYIALATEFFLRFHFQKPFARKSSTPEEETSVDKTSEKEEPLLIGFASLPRSTLIVVSGLALATLTGYRTVELSDGWTGRIITTQRFFNYLDGAPICLALFILNVLHPRFVY
ncbi:hypothetical protein Clacol_010284 [Clathrus columnatus]|uniref:Amidohydrolase-related domain-containing protein n=1 Tax=Clathrus columnatus TaxID=1419009 RepID=A0AAV5ANF8_9AGAM|nr:hypothetical protein Clacol_010284 [Clathrus columnatus]